MVEMDAAEEKIAKRKRYSSQFNLLKMFTEQMNCQLKPFRFTKTNLGFTSNKLIILGVKNIYIYYPCTKEDIADDRLVFTHFFTACHDVVQKRNRCLLDFFPDDIIWTSGVLASRDGLH